MMTTPAAQSREQQHACLPRTARPCPMCGEPVPVAVYCGVCGEDTTPQHVCAPHPLTHICTPASTRGTCLACGQAFTAPHFCATCGADITPSHQCPAASATTVRRADPLHICPKHEIKRCPDCNVLLPALTFCEHCGVEITAPHQCPPKPQTHVCAPLVTMPRRCSKCGELMPASQHCTHCGADTKSQHQCA